MPDEKTPDRNPMGFRYITKEEAERMEKQPLTCPFCEAGVPKKPLGRDEALRIYQEAAGTAYKLRWTESQGDFSGRERTIDVFNVPVREQRVILRSMNAVRDQADRLAGGRCLFIMHTPEATKEHYSHLL